MTAYKVGRVYIENFKHIEKVNFDFANKNLIVLDGPNGFGKTTVFDVIELVLCGKVTRVTNTSDGRYGYKDFLFSSNNNEDSVIKVEFYNEEQRYTIVKRFNSNAKLKASDRRPDNWNLFETYLIENFEDHIDNYAPTDMKDIYSKLGIDDFNRYYSLFYYIQQEDNTYFLKKSAKERMSELSQLFDTYEEQRQLNKLEILKTELEREKRNIVGNNGVLTSKETLFNTLTNGLQSVNVNELVKEEYFQLIQGVLPLQEWDKNNVLVSENTRNLFLKDLRKLYDFVKNFNEFLKARENAIIQTYIENDKLLTDTIITSYFMDDIDRIREVKKKEVKITNLKKLLNRENIQKNLRNFPLVDLDTYIDLEIDFDAMKVKLELLGSYKKSATSLSVILQELNSTRDTLMKHFEKINHLGFGGEENCPLCGQNWESYEQLIKSVEAKKDTFQQHYDSSANKFDEELNLLYKDFLNPIIQWIDSYLSNDKNIINEEFLEQLSNSIKDKQKIEVFADWCKINNIDLKQFINTKREYVNDLEENRENLANYLANKKQRVKEGYSELDDSYLSFSTIFSSLFNEEESLVHSIKLEQIVKKANYINYQYYHASSETIKKLEEEILKLKLRLSKVTTGIDIIKDAIIIYKKQITSHWTKILRDIEIPFFIYSGKILQDYQRGLGIFIQESEGDGVKNIKFVSSFDTDHDAINYLSSGQLSGLIIAFTLALNKVYGNNSMEVLLIDDPVQTMDEINMASFVELLRNEFKEKQIFLSTHEDDVSRFIRYKFKKYNLETLRLNIKERLYN